MFKSAWTILKMSYHLRRVEICAKNLQKEACFKHMIKVYDMLLKAGDSNDSLYAQVVAERKQLIKMQNQAFGFEPWFVALPRVSRSIYSGLVGKV